MQAQASHLMEFKVFLHDLIKSDALFHLPIQQVAEIISPLSIIFFFFSHALSSVELILPVDFRFLIYYYHSAIMLRSGAIFGGFLPFFSSSCVLCGASYYSRFILPPPQMVVIFSRSSLGGMVFNVFFFFCLLHGSCGKE